MSVRKTVEVEVKIGLVMLWSDSEIALYLIRGLRKKWKQWAVNRVTKIRSLTGTECWCLASGEANRADLATRHKFY